MYLVINIIITVIYKFCLTHTSLRHRFTILDTNCFIILVNSILMKSICFVSINETDPVQMPKRLWNTPRNY